MVWLVWWMGRLSKERDGDGDDDDSGDRRGFSCMAQWLVLDGCLVWN